MDEERDRELEKFSGGEAFPAEETAAEPDQRAYYMEEKITLQDITHHISGPIISIVVHIILLTVVGTAILFDPPPKEREEILVETKNVEINKPLEPPPPPPPPPEMEITDATFSDVVVDRPAPAQTEQHFDAPSPMATSSVATANTDFTDNLMVESSMPVVSQSKSALKLPGAFAMRSKAGRLRAIKSYGGSANTERSVEKALDWLVKVQNEDGSWGDEEDQYNQMVQLTCLALLAFLAHGETPDSERYGETLMKGLRKVLEWTENGKYQPNRLMGKRGKGDWYSHSRICIVLSEGYAITKIPALERGMNQAVEVIIHGRTDSEENHWLNRGQNPIGGWGWWYDNRKGEWIYGTNLDEGSRIYNALYSAWNAGCEVPGIKEAIKKSAKGMATFNACKKGGFSYGMARKYEHEYEKGISSVPRPEGGSPSFDATGAGTLYLYLMAAAFDDSEKEVMDQIVDIAKEGFNYLAEYTPKDGAEMKMDFKYLPDSQTPSLGWYYMTQAIFQSTSGKGKLWRRWNKSVIQALLKEQDRHGFWLPPADKYPRFDVKKINVGKPDKPRWKEERVEKIYNESIQGGFTEHNGKLWATVYLTLALEVYYRYLPTFKSDGSRTPLYIGEDAQTGEEVKTETKTSGTEEENELSLGE